MSYHMTQASSWEQGVPLPHFTAQETETPSAGGARQGHTESDVICRSDSGLGHFLRLPVTAWLWGVPSGRWEDPGRIIRGRGRTCGRAGMGSCIWARLTRPLPGGASHLGQRGGAIRPPTPFLSLDVHCPLPQTQDPCLLTHLWKWTAEIATGDPPAESSPYVPLL